MNKEISGENYTILQLREWLRKLNIPTSGNKATLILRLNDVAAEDRGVCPSVDEEAQDNVSYDNNNSDGNENDICEMRRELDHVKRELALIEKEKQLLVYENDLLKRDSASRSLNASSTKENNAFNFSTIRDFLPDYNGEGSADLWVSQLKNLSENFNLDEDSIKALFVCKVKGNVQVCLHSKADYMSSNVNILLNEMCNIFKKQGSKLLLRRKFENRKWIRGENFMEYYGEKIKLSNGLNLDDSEIVDYLIEGIDNCQLRTQATLQCFTAPEDLLRAFMNIEFPKVAVNK